MEARLRKAALLAALVAPLLARAQDPGQAAPPMQEDPRAPRYHEVERGFFIGFEPGALVLLKTPLADRVAFPFAAASAGSTAYLASVGVEIGYDVTRRFAMSLFALGANGSPSANYGAFSVLAGGVDLRLALAAWHDGQGVERWFPYVHARGGLLVTRPKGLFGDTDELFAGGVGIEYFTHLRHFSVALGLDGAYLPKAATAGFSPFASVRYTF